MKTANQLFAVADIGRLALLVAGYLATAVVPRRMDRRVVTALALAYRTARRARLRALPEKIRRIMGDALGERDVTRLVSEVVEARMEELWGRARDLHPCGWRPQIRIEGTEHLIHGLDKKRGVVVWLMRSCGVITPKRAFWQAGYPLTFLHSEAHGSTTQTRLGLGIVARLYAHAENQYLAERVLIPHDGSLRYLKTLTRRLEENACVALTGEHHGRRNVSANFLAFHREYATGAPSLAIRCGAPLVTAFCVREGFGRYRLVIEEPIPLDYDAARKDEIHRAVQEFSTRLSRFVMRHPESWQGWLLPYVVDGLAPDAPSS